MPVVSAKRPRCIVIAAPNGSGKTTFARDFLPGDAGVVHCGLNVPREDVEWRFVRGWENFQHTYRPLADAWVVYDNSGSTPRLKERVGHD